MNPVVTSKEEILAASRELIRSQGWQAVNIRSVAAACGVSVGSIYNYYGSKSRLTAAAVESVWCEIFHQPGEEPADILACLRGLYERMAWGAREYPGFFSLHALGFVHLDKEDGRRLMGRTWQHIRDSLCGVLRRDPHIRPDAFNPAFTPEAFADLLFSQLLALEKQLGFTDKAVGRVLVAFHLGLNVTAVTLLARGVVQVLGTPVSTALNASLSGVAGIGHILLGVSLILLLLRIRKCAGK